MAKRSVTRILWVIVFVGMIVIHIVCKELIFLVIDAAYLCIYSVRTAYLAIAR
jgi:hypothetical protein